MVRHLVLQRQAAEPAISEIVVDVFAELPFRRDAVEVGHQFHPEVDFWIDRRTAQDRQRSRRPSTPGRTLCPGSSAFLSTFLRQTKYLQSPFAEYFVPISQNVSPGIGIRRNGDDDNHNGWADNNPTVETQVVNEDDLIHVVIATYPQALSGVKYVISRSTKDINVYSNSDKTGVLLGPGTADNVVLTAGGNVYVEWATMNAAATSSTLTLKGAHEY